MMPGRGRRFLVLAVVVTALCVGAGIVVKKTRQASAAGSASAAAPASAYAFGSPSASGSPGGAGSPGAATPQKAGGEAPAAAKPGDSPTTSKSGEEAAKTAIPVSVAAISKGDVSSYITSTANLVPEQEVKILAEAEGRVADLEVEEGSRVVRGQILASLAHEDAEIAFKKAELRAGSAKSVYVRMESLLKDNLISREGYDKAALDNEVAGQELAEARFRLEKTFIRAPFSGHITDRAIKLGQHVRPGENLFTLSDFDPLVARIYLPEKDVYGLREGRDVRITLKANESTRFHGRIRQISPVVDTATGTVKITVEATARPAEVRPGAFVTLDIVREVHEQAVLVPREAVIRELQDAYVFVARGEKAEKRAVSLGLEEGGRIEALSGVAPGDQVIVAGQGGLRQGSTIKIIPIREASDLGAVAEHETRG